MPVYLLGNELVFPPPEGASKEGLIAVGGTVNPERLVLAYSQGIFPWPSEGMPMLWFSPHPRFVLEPAQLHVPHSLRKRLKKSPYKVRFDTQFEQVIDACARANRPGQTGTWITDELRTAYIALHRQGLAHSIEAYQGQTLVGGLYGVSLGTMFFGESMFADAPDASKIAFVTLVENLKQWGFTLIDCQVYTEHLSRFGAKLWPREKFLHTLRDSLTSPTHFGPWEIE